MYEYRVVTVGDVRALRRRHTAASEVIEAGDSTEAAVQAALDNYASAGWKLHTCQIADRRNGTILVFERLTKASAERLAKALEQAG